MIQLTLYAPDITCEHCVGTIESTAQTVPGIRFLHGDPNAREFAVEVERGAALDELEVALAAAGYPLGDAPGIPGAGVARLDLLDLRPAQPAATAMPAGSTGAWTPTYRVTRTEAGADVNYECPCGCTAGFAVDRARAEQAPESCCCGRTLLVGRDAEARLRATLDRPDDYTIDVQAIAMPWGQPLEAALAVPRAA